jgi:Mg2+/citrate symporter
MTQFADYKSLSTLAGHKIILLFSVYYTFITKNDPIYLQTVAISVDSTERYGKYPTKIAAAITLHN